MCSKWNNLSILEKLTFIERLSPTQADLVFNSIGDKKLVNVLWILEDQLKKSLNNLISVPEAADFFHNLPKRHREKLVTWTDAN